MTSANVPLPCGSLEPPIGIKFAARCHAWLVLLCEDLTDEFSTAAHADLVEDGFEVVAYGVWRDVKLAGDLGRRQPAGRASPSRFFRP